MKDIAPINPALVEKLAGVSETSLLTLYCRATESRSHDPILRDEAAVELIRRLSPALAASSSKMLQKLARGRVNPQLNMYISLRAHQYDEYSTDFITRHPQGVIVNLGCGMDTRFQRIDNGSLLFLDLDLPEVIVIKKELLPEGERYHMLGSSVFDTGWMDQIKSLGERPTLFLAEGLFMYLDAEKVKELILALQSRFPGSELVCEVFNSMWLKGPLKGIIKSKMQGQFGFKKDTDYHFGISNSREMESWHSGIQFLDEWCYFDTGHPKLGTLRFFKKSEFMRKVQWTVHYRLN
jgi:methyltransferase (TIGR00027 family)